MPGKVWDELTYPFLSFNGCTVEVYEWLSNFIQHSMMDVIYLSMLWLELIHVSKGATYDINKVMLSYERWLMHIIFEEL